MVGFGGFHPRLTRHSNTLSKVKVHSYHHILLLVWNIYIYIYIPFFGITMSNKAAIFRAIAEARRSSRRFQKNRSIPDATLKDILETTLVSKQRYRKDRKRDLSNE